MTNTTLILKYGLPTMNDIIKASKQVRKGKGHYYSAYTTLKKKYTTLIAEELVAQSCVPDQPYDTVWLITTWGENTKKRDPDGLRAGIKFVLDAMVNVGIIPDDSREYVIGMTDYFEITRTRGVKIDIQGEYSP